MQDQVESSANNLSNSKLRGVIKTLLWLCVFIAFGWLVGGQFFKGKPERPAEATKQNVTSSDDSLSSYDSPRVKELDKEFPDLSFAVLSDFDYYSPDPGATPDPELLKKNKIPDKLKVLNGKKVAVAGFMMPIDQNQDGTTEFVLNGNYDMCGFGGPISINQWMLVKYTGQGKVPYTHLPITVFGTLEVGEEYKDGYLYGFDGEHESQAALVCLEWATGKLMWREQITWNEQLFQGGDTLEQEYHPGRASLLSVDGHFLCLGERGHLLWLDLSPEGPKVLNRVWLVQSPNIWGVPVVSQGLLYVNQPELTLRFDPPRLLCFDLRGTTEEQAEE